MKLKPSEYNFIYDDLGQDQIVFYNSFSGTLAVVKMEQYQQYKEFVATGKEIQDADFYHKLLNYGFLLPVDVDEHFLLKNRMLSGRYSQDTLSLTIAPTMACNFRCIYCFEQGHYGNLMMDAQTQESLMEFVKSHSSGVKQIAVSWFGGEPLMGLPIIESLSKRLLDFCEEKNIQYRAGIITNGYLFTKAVAEKLKECRVNMAQITIDGSQAIHDSRRPLVNGMGTYKVIIKNLEDTLGILPISLRINVDCENISAADQVVEYLKSKNMLGSVHPYLGLVIPYNDSYQKNKCLTDEVYSKSALQFLLRHNLPLSHIYPTPRKNHCVADHCNGWVIDDAGYVYKCWNDIGNLEYAVGNINLKNSFLQSTELVSQYSDFDPCQEGECKSCKMLPSCMGGCPHDRREGRMVCDRTRFYLREYMTECTKYILSQRAGHTA